MYDIVQNAFDTGLVVVIVGLALFLGGFGLGPRSDVSRPSPSGGEKFTLGVRGSMMGLGLIPHFALGSIPDISRSASTGGDSLVLGVNDMDGGFDVRGSEIRDVG